MGSERPFLLALKKGLAKSVNLEEKTIKFDEVGVLSFGERMAEILNQAGFQGTLLEVLTTFCSGLDKVFRNLLRTPHELTGDEYGAQARVLLGFQAVQIFRSISITASCKQIVTYVPYYIDKALADVTNSPLLWQTSVMQQWKLRTNRTKESPCFFLEEDLAQ